MTPCECECEHGDGSSESTECGREAEATCPLCELEVCLRCMEGDEGEHLCTTCWDAVHVGEELPECDAEGHSHRATWLVAISTSSPVVRITLCPAERAIYDAQGYGSARLVRDRANAADAGEEGAAA